MPFKPVLVWFNDNQSASCLPLAALQKAFQLVQMDNVDAMQAYLVAGRPMDVVLIEGHGSNQLSADLLAHFEAVPVVVVSRDILQPHQRLLLAAGVHDCIDLNHCSDALLLARLRQAYELKKRSDILVKVANLDRLTCIPNRQGFELGLDKEWRRCSREFNLLSGLLVSIDAFAEYGANYGHGVANTCLSRIAEVIAQHCLRAADFVARYSDDQFAVLLPSTDLDHALLVAEKLRSAVEALNIKHDFSPVGDTMTVTVAVVSAEPNNREEPAALVAELQDLLQTAISQQQGNQVTGINL
jgi:diguanylate cyclase (GGDEF)-like protein